MCTYVCVCVCVCTCACECTCEFFFFRVEGGGGGKVEGDFPGGESLIQSASRAGVRVVQGSKILNFRGMSFMYDPIMEIQNYEDFRNFEETFD